MSCQLGYLNILIIFSSGAQSFTPELVRALPAAGHRGPLCPSADRMDGRGRTAQWSKGRKMGAGLPLTKVQCLLLHVDSILKLKCSKTLGMSARRAVYDAILLTTTHPVISQKSKLD